MQEFSLCLTLYICCAIGRMMALEYSLCNINLEGLVKLPSSHKDFLIGRMMVLWCGLLTYVVGQRKEYNGSKNVKN